MHWFDYPAPAATGSRGMMEFNSGAMVIEVSRVSRHMHDYLSLLAGSMATVPSPPVLTLRFVLLPAT
jgi:hypothetical protein